MVSTEEAYWCGVYDFQAGLTMCPYKFEYDLALAWLHGWIDAGSGKHQESFVLTGAL